MKILVGFKRVIDYRLTARPNAAGTAVDLSGVKMAPNPFDEIALEEALKLKESGKATEVIALGIGDDKTPETLRTALAMGADKAIHVASPASVDGFDIAQVFAKIAKEQGCSLILLGKQAIDTDNGQTPSMTAELLGWSQALNAYKIELEGAVAKVTCEIDGGLETFGFSLPAVISVDLRLNTPRFVKMPDIIKARSKPIETAEFSFSAPRIVTEKVFTPKQARQNILFETTDQLAQKLEGLL